MVETWLTQECETCKYSSAWDCLCSGNAHDSFSFWVQWPSFTSMMGSLHPTSLDEVV